MIEVHQNPEEAFSDGDQSLKPNAFGQMIKELKAIAKVVGRTL
jgi:3-deoxy-7-phosphoheptulonate synthase